jgi:hypothetical protein
MSGMDKEAGNNIMDKALDGETFPDPTREKRRYERYPADILDIHGRILFSSGITIHNISVGGIAFSTDKTLLAGRNYALRLESKGRILNIMGTIMWSQLSSANQENGNVRSICTVGMKFLNLSGRQVIELEHFIKDNFKDYQRLETEGELISGIRLHVRFHIYDPEKATLNYVEQFKVRKISQSGMLVESKCPLEIEDAVPMTMDLSETQSIAFWGRIVTCQAFQGAEPQIYEIGIEFTDMSESDGTVLREFIASLESSLHSP